MIVYFVHCHLKYLRLKKEKKFLFIFFMLLFFGCGVTEVCKNKCSARRRKERRKRIPKMWIWIVEMWKYYEISFVFFLSREKCSSTLKCVFFWLLEFLCISSLTFYAYYILFKWLEHCMHTHIHSNV